MPWRKTHIYVWSILNSISYIDPLLIWRHICCQLSCSLIQQIIYWSHRYNNLSLTYFSGEICGHGILLGASFRYGCALTYWSRATHIHAWVSKLTLTGSDNGLSPERYQPIKINAGILLNGTLQTNLTEIFSKIRAFSFTKKHLKTSSILSRPQCVKVS